MTLCKNSVQYDNIGNQLYVYVMVICNNLLHTMSYNNCYDHKNDGTE